MWLAYYTQEEIAAAIGFSRPAVSQFIESLNSVRNGADAVSDKLDGNGELGNAERYLEFEEDDTNSLGVYEIEEGAVAAGRVVRGTGARGAGAVLRRGAISLGGACEKAFAAHAAGMRVLLPLAAGCGRSPAPAASAKPIIPVQNFTELNCETLAVVSMLRHERRTACFRSAGGFDATSAYSGCSCSGAGRHPG